MTPVEFERQLTNAGNVQRDAGWSEESIRLYTEEMRLIPPGAVLMVCAGLACDNTRFGVPNPPESNQESASDLLSESLARELSLTQTLERALGLLEQIQRDSGFRNLFDDLQEQISTSLNDADAAAEEMKSGVAGQLTAMTKMRDLWYEKAQDVMAVNKRLQDKVTRKNELLTKALTCWVDTEAMEDPSREVGIRKEIKANLAEA